MTQYRKDRMSPQYRSRKPPGAGARINVLRKKYFIALFFRNIPQNRKTAEPQNRKTANRRTAKPQDKPHEIFLKSPVHQTAISFADQP